MPSTTNKRHEATKPRAEAHHNKNHNKQQHNKQPSRQPAPPSRQRSKGSLKIKRLPAPAQREVDAFTSWLEQPTKDGSKGWTYGLRELQLAASQDCVGCLLIADDSLDAHYSSTDPAVAALAKRVRASKGDVFTVAVAEVAGVCGLAGRLRRPVCEEEEEAWEEELRLEATVPAMARSLSKLVGPALEEGSEASCDSSLGDEARDELTLLEASFGIDGHYRRLMQASFQLLVDADGDAGFLVMEVGLPEAYPSAAPTVRIHGSSRVHGSNMSRAMRAAASDALEASMKQNVGTPMLFELHEAARAWLEEA